jgi:hypothetical protein
VLKLLAMLVAFLLVALTLLGLRQRRLEITSESAGIYAQIRERNETLLDQRVEISRISNPWTLAANLKNAGVNTGSALENRKPVVGRPLPAIEQDLTSPIR